MGILSLPFLSLDRIWSYRNLLRIISDVLLEKASEEDVVLLVVGDPFGATTHTDLVLR